jgi:plastocyanin
MRRAVICAALGLMLTASVPGAAAAPEARRAPRTHTVTIDASRFEPARLTVEPGDTIVWKNIDMFPHTATSSTGAFDSKEIKPGTSWKYLAKKNGIFDYICSLHPTMKGSVRVRSTSAP